MDHAGSFPQASPTDSTPEQTICAQFCCSDFYLFKDETNLNTAGDALNGPIHPIFARQYWENTGFSDYESIRMMLKLASKLLSTDAVAEFIATAVDGDLYVDVDPNGDGSGKFVRPKQISVASPMPRKKDEATGHDRTFQYGYFLRRYYKTDVQSIFRGLETTNEDFAHFQQRAALLRMPKRGLRTTNPAMRARARTVLAGMEGLIRYRVSNLRRGSSIVTGRHSCCQGPLSERLDQLWPFARESRILLNKANLDEMIASQKEFAEGKIDEIRLRIKQFEIVNTLIHELGHAINAAANGHMLGSKVGFRENACIEAGFDLISHIYGGVMQESMLAFPLPKSPHMNPGNALRKQYLVMSEWPSGLKFAGYIAAGNTIARRGNLPISETLTRVPHAFVMKLFTNKFWTDHAATGRKSDLRARGPRWTYWGQQTTSVEYRLSSLVNDLPPNEVKKLLQIITRQPGVKRALADLEDDLYIMSTMADAWPEEDKEPKIVSDARIRRSSRVLAKGDAPEIEPRRALQGREQRLAEAVYVGTRTKRRRIA